jgi:hypothetical protein
VFIVLAFFGLTAHATRMLAGEPGMVRGNPLPASCIAAVAFAAVPVLVLGFWMPSGMSSLLQAAAKVLGGS